MSEQNEWLDAMKGSEPDEEEVAEFERQQQLKDADDDTDAVASELADDAAATVSVADETPPGKASSKADKPTAEERPRPDADAAAASARREERERWEKRETEWKKDLDSLKAQLDALTRPKPPEVPAKAAPTFEDDPAGYLRTQTEEVKQRLEENSKRTQQFEQEQAKQRWLSQQLNAIAEAETSYAAEAPDYREAVEHVRRLDAARLELLPETSIDAAIRSHGYQPTGTLAQKRAQLQGLNEISTAITLMQTGENPAKAFYTLAQKAGYSRATPPPVPPQPTASAARGIKEGRSSSAVGGGAQPSSVDPFEELFGAKQ